MKVTGETFSFHHKRKGAEEARYQMIVVVAGSPKELILMLITNFVIGSLMGYFIGRFGEK